MWNQDALTAHLRSITGAEVTMSFVQIDAVVGELPDSARTHNAYWANSLTSRPHSRAWLDAGFTASPDFVRGVVRFTRGAAPTPAGATRRPAPVRTRPPLVLVPSGESHCGQVCYAWLNASKVEVENGPLSMPALGPEPGIYRFELRDASGEVQSYYVGESDNLFKRMNGYRSPGPTQSTNLRMNLRFVSVLEEGGSVGVNVVLEATLDDTPLDLAYKPARLIVENTELVRLKLAGATIENRGNDK